MFCVKIDGDDFVFGCFLWGKVFGLCLMYFVLLIGLGVGDFFGEV